MRARPSLAEEPRVCCSYGCEETPDASESETTGDFVDDDGKAAWICLGCWIVVALT